MKDLQQNMVKQNVIFLASGALVRKSPCLIDPGDKIIIVF